MKTGASMATGAVTFLDVLGWRGIWAREQASDPVERLRTLLRKAQSTAEAASQRGGLRGVTTEVKSISDTIVLQTAGAATDALSLHAEVCAALVALSIEQRLPLRGATAYGEFLPGVDPHDTIVVGPAVDEAASWHEATDWIGVVLTPSAALAAARDKGVGNKWVTYDAIPVKRGRMLGLHCLDWRPAWVGGADALHDAFSQMGPLIVEVAPKYLNTLSFFSWKTRPTESPR